MKVKHYPVITYHSFGIFTLTWKISCNASKRIFDYFDIDADCGDGIGTTAYSIVDNSTFRL